MNIYTPTEMAKKSWPLSFLETSNLTKRAFFIGGDGWTATQIPRHWAIEILGFQLFQSV